MMLTTTTCLDHHSKEWGYIRYLIPSADNSNAAFRTEDKSGLTRIIFRNQIVAEVASFPWGAYLRYSLSFDGKQLAIAIIEDGKYKISINGKPKYETTSYIHHLDWIDNSRLAWKSYGKVKDQDSGDREVCINGQPVKDFNFEPVGLDRRQHGIQVREGNQVYGIYGIDQKTKIVTLSDEDLASDPFSFSHTKIWEELWGELCGWKEIWDNRGRTIDDKVFEEKVNRYCYQVIFNGIPGPKFDAKPDGMQRHIYQNGNLGYLGLRYPRWAKWIGNLASMAIESCEDELKWYHYWKYLYMIPTVILFNPYFGLGLALTEGSARTHPVKNQEAWKKGYPSVQEIFFTSGSHLVAKIWDGKGCRVVIDESEGPSFDEIANIIEESKKISYIARKDDLIVRVEHLC